MFGDVGSESRRVLLGQGEDIKLMDVSLQMRTDIDTGILERELWHSWTKRRALHLTLGITAAPFSKTMPDVTWLEQRGLGPPRAANNSPPPSGKS